MFLYISKECGPCGFFCIMEPRTYEKYMAKFLTVIIFLTLLQQEHFLSSMFNSCGDIYLCRSFTSICILCACDNMYKL